MEQRDLEALRSFYLRIKRKVTAENDTFQSVRLRENWQTYVSLSLLANTEHSAADYEAELLHSLIYYKVSNLLCLYF